MRASLVAIMLLAGVSACATNDTVNRYQQDLEKLEADCRELGGVLVPTGGQTGRPETENACRITGGASRIS